jgi:hypothetical protein
MMDVMIVGMRVRHPIVRMFVRVLRAGRRIGMRMIVMPVIMGMLMRMRGVIVCVSVRMLGHRYLPSCKSVDNTYATLGWNFRKEGLSEVSAPDPWITRTHLSFASSLPLWQY